MKVRYVVNDPKDIVNKITLQEILDTTYIPAPSTLIVWSCVIYKIEQIVYNINYNSVQIELREYP